MMQADPADFSPPLLRMREKPPSPLAGWTLRLLVALLAALGLWALLGRLDIVAVADGKPIQAEYDNKRLALRRIDAQLGAKPLSRMRGDPAELYAQVSAQYAASVRAYQNALAQERALLDKARHDLAGAQATKAK